MSEKQFPESPDINDAAALAIPNTAPKQTRNPNDPFGLEGKIELDTDSVHLLFDQCEGLSRAHALQNPDLRPALQAGDLVLPIQTKAKDKQFQLTRISDDRFISFTFQRLGKGYEQSGFRVIRDRFSTADVTLLTFNGIDNETPASGEEYEAHVKQAKSLLDSYVKALGMKPKNVAEYATVDVRPVPIETNRQKLGKAAFRIVAAPFSRPYYSDGKQITKESGHDAAVPNERLDKRYLSAARLALFAALVPWPGHLTSLNADTFKPASYLAVDDILYNGEHSLNHHRLTFDRQGLNLPGNMPEVQVGDISTLASTPALPQALATEIASAPRVKVGSGKNQELAGGIRKIIGLATDQHGVLNISHELFAGDCDTLKVTIPVGDAIRVANIEPDVSGDLQFQVHPTDILMCNVGTQSIDPDEVTDIYIQEVPATS